MWLMASARTRSSSWPRRNPSFNSYRGFTTWENWICGQLWTITTFIPSYIVSWPRAEIAKHLFTTTRIQRQALAGDTFRLILSTAFWRYRTRVCYQIIFSFKTCISISPDFVCPTTAAQPRQQKQKRTNKLQFTVCFVDRILVFWHRWVLTWSYRYSFIHIMLSSIDIYTNTNKTLHLYLLLHKSQPLKPNIENVLLLLTLFVNGNQLKNR